MSVPGAFIALGNWLSRTGFCGPVIFALAGSPVVVSMPSWGRSGFPRVGVSWWGTGFLFEPITLSFRSSLEAVADGCSLEHLDRRLVSPPVPVSLRPGLVSANHQNM